MAMLLNAVQRHDNALSTVTSTKFQTIQHTITR